MRLVAKDFDVPLHFGDSRLETTTRLITNSPGRILSIVIEVADDFDGEVLLVTPALDENRRYVFFACPFKKEGS